ncbi:MAG: adenylate/guanylate cyclase domain-containing protein [Rhodospirillales bacterium]|nr:adenylate/guanylate cyclase domain-containing protein [Rhodospirillales bacterium]
MENNNSSILTDEPFPLKSKFYRTALPGLIVVAALVVGLSIFSTLSAMKEVYLKLAQDRAETLVRSAIKLHPTAWDAFMQGTLSIEDMDILRKGFQEEVHELKLDKLKIYTENGLVIYSSKVEDIGKVESGLIFKLVVRTGKAEINSVSNVGHEELLEIYLPYRHSKDSPLLIFELYDPAGHIDSIVIRNGLLPALIPAALFIILIVLFWKQVSQGQKDIDQRTSALSSLSNKLESLVSNSAVSALRGIEGEAQIPSEKVYCTLFYSDIRDFTGFSEQKSPEAVVNFLNEIMGLQIDILKRFGGDVDKMIGDALLVRFDGVARHRDAVEAALEIQREITNANLARSVGIGVYSGLVVSGVIGPPDRRDFTVIGDSVNTAARLCTAAGEGEVVVDTETATQAGTECDKTETLQVKGRRLPLTVVRLKP